MQSLQEFYNKRKILVTGGAGFIGSHLVEQLVHLGAYVTILDNFSTGNRENTKNLENNIHIIEDSITHFNACTQACKNIDTVFHLAAVVSVAHSQNNPQFCLETNVGGTQHILEACRTNSTRRAIFASSAAVYGNHVGTCKEDTPQHPVSTYGYSKLIGEQLCELYANTYNLETITLRFFNVYGPRQNPAAGNGGVLAVLNQKLAENKPITIFGDGEQTRDFIHVDQIVNALLHAGMVDKKYATGQAFNIGTGTSSTLNAQLQKLLLKYPEYNQKIEYAPERKGDIRHSQADCSKFQKALNL